jgi:ectoine hydroxylase
MSNTSKLLTATQIQAFHEQGYLGVSGLVSDAWLAQLNLVTSEFIDQSRSIEGKGEGKDRRFDVEPDHSASNPRLRRLNSPIDLHDTYWRFASEGPFAQVAQDLLGENVKFHHSKLNFKWATGGEEVKWHQDIQFWLHTNYDVLTLGVYLTDVDASMAPMGIIPGSHQQELFDLYDEAQRWTGNIREADLPRVDTNSAQYVQGPAGTMTAHHCRAVHGSGINSSDRLRPLLLCAYSAADAIPITNLTDGGLHSEAIISGERARWARFDARPCLLPPDWRKAGGQKSIFEHQQKQ